MDRKLVWTEKSSSDIEAIVRYIARAGYDIEVHLKKRPRLEQRPELRCPTSIVVRYDYYGRVIAST